jgi:hypothetical protein
MTHQITQKRSLDSDSRGLSLSFRNATTTTTTTLLPRPCHSDTKRLCPQRKSPRLFDDGLVDGQWRAVDLDDILQQLGQRMNVRGKAVNVPFPDRF